MIKKIICLLIGHKIDLDKTKQYRIVMMTAFTAKNLIAAGCFTKICKRCGGKYQ